MRSANQEPNKTFVVLPDGEITASYYCTGVASPFIAVQGDMIGLKPWASRAGVRFLEDLYEDEPNDKIREEGFKVWSAWWDGEYGTSLEAKRMADLWLPAKVRELRAKHAKPEAAKAASMPTAPKAGK